MVIGHPKVGATSVRPNCTALLLLLLLYIAILDEHLEHIELTIADGHVILVVFVGWR